MPGVEVAVAKISQETAEAYDAAEMKDPPSPYFAGLERKLSQPEVNDRNGGWDPRSSPGRGT